MTSESSAEPAKRRPRPSSPGPAIIPSVWARHQDLPRKHGYVQLDEVVALNGHLDNIELDRAKALVKYLEAIYELGADPAITRSVVATAKVRAGVIEKALFKAHCEITEPEGPRESESVLHPRNLDGSDGLGATLAATSTTPRRAQPLPSDLEQKVKAETPSDDTQSEDLKSAIAAARRTNYEIKLGNFIEKTKRDKRPIQKTVPGNGEALIQQFPEHIRKNDTMHQLLLFTETPLAPYKHAKIGDVPIAFLGGDTVWSPEYILTLIYFYNTDFGIDPRRDSLATWSRKAMEAFTV